MTRASWMGPSGPRGEVGEGFTSYTIRVVWTDDRSYEYEPYNSRTLAESHFVGLTRQKSVKSLKLIAKTHKDDPGHLLKEWTNG